MGLSYKYVVRGGLCHGEPSPTPAFCELNSYPWCLSGALHPCSESDMSRPYPREDVRLIEYSLLDHALATSDQRRDRPSDDFCSSQEIRMNRPVQTVRRSFHESIISTPESKLSSDSGDRQETHRIVPCLYVYGITTANLLFHRWLP
jgi:hypothetical protein